jgi:hypothetical protein
MCNLYSVTKGQSAIRDLFSVKHDRAGNLPPLPAILPDQMAPIVRVGPDGERESEPCHAPRTRASRVVGSLDPRFRGMTSRGMQSPHDGRRRPSSREKQ